MTTPLKRVLLILTVLLGFIPLPFLATTKHLFVTMNAIGIAVGAAVIVAYSRGAYRWIFNGPTRASHLLVLGFLATWIAASIRLGWSWIWRYLDQPEGFLDNEIFAYGIYLFVVGGVLSLVAHGAIDDDIPPKSWVRAGIIVGVGVALGLAFIALLE